jgi:predicted nucleic acid-binding protein
MDAYPKPFDPDRIVLELGRHEALALHGAICSDLTTPLGAGEVDELLTALERFIAGTLVDDRNARSRERTWTAEEIMDREG